MKELTDEQLKKLKKCDTSELVQIMADAVKQAGENLQNLSPNRTGRGLEIGCFASEPTRQRRQID